jgi:hypothetical protein
LEDIDNQVIDRAADKTAGISLACPRKSQGQGKAGKHDD